MHGQVLSSNMGLVNMGSYDPFFSFPIPSPPNLDFMDDNVPFLHSVHQEGGVNVRQIDQEQIMQQNIEQQQSIQKKPYRRHTDWQIHEMEAVFKECTHPDDKLRKRLSQELGLTPRQIRFWFQNHRTQLKARQDQADNVVLRAENQKLKAVNLRLRSIICNLVCPNCNGPAMLKEMCEKQHLRRENTCLEEDLERLPSSLTGSYTSNLPPQMMGNTAPPFLASLDVDTGMDMGIFPATNLPEQLPHDIAQGTVPAQAPPEPFQLWGGGENGGVGEGWAAMGGGGQAGEDGLW